MDEAVRQEEKLALAIFQEIKVEPEVVFCVTPRILELIQSYGNQRHDEGVEASAKKAEATGISYAVKWEDSHKDAVMCTGDECGREIRTLKVGEK